jgi:hypothetical protein
MPGKPERRAYAGAAGWVYAAFQPRFFRRTTETDCVGTTGSRSQYRRSRKITALPNRDQRERSMRTVLTQTLKPRVPGHKI